MSLFFRPLVSSAQLQVVGAATLYPLQVKSSSVTFDRTWAPHIQGQLVVRRLDDATAAATDPRKAVVIRLTFRNITSDGSDSTLNLVAWLRARVSDYLTDETTLTFASVESLFQDYADIAGNQYSSDQYDRNLLLDMLRRVQQFNDGTITLQDAGGIGGFNVKAADAGWDPGTAVFDMADTLESTKSVWLHGDETGLVLIRSDAGYTADASTFALSSNNRIVSVQDTVDRDNPDWANGVYINYVYNSGKNTDTDYGNVAGATVLKTKVINRQGRRSSTGEASARAARMNRRGRTLAVTAVADYALRPNRPISLAFRGITRSGTVRSVTFRHPEGLMDVLVDIIDP